MWGLAPIQKLSRSDKYKIFGRPQKMLIPDGDLWKKGELVRPLNVPESLWTAQLYIGDFGISMRLGTPDPLAPANVCPPSDFCSPDRLHGKSPSTACDMWSYMIIFTELYIGFPPFNPSLDGGIITGIVDYLGPLPENWKGTYKSPNARDFWYDQSRKPRPGFTFRKKVESARPDADPAEVKPVVDIMSKVFTYNIEKRLTATQLLQDPSFKEIMDKYGC